MRTRHTKNKIESQKQKKNTKYSIALISGNEMHCEFSYGYRRFSFIEVFSNFSLLQFDFIVTAHNRLRSTHTHCSLYF